MDDSDAAGREGVLTSMTIHIRGLPGAAIDASARFFPTQFHGPNENGTHALTLCMSFSDSGCACRPSAMSQRSGQNSSACEKLRGSRCTDQKCMRVWVPSGI